jgi:3-isopropylmalate/(R)-2-methylmalate dehydratase small subunit
MKIREIKGRGMAIRGNDIDTDRILPARHMKSLTFQGIEAHLFEDERRVFADHGRMHPVADPRFQDASILFVNDNFGCGSSREHAPQSLMRRGIRAIVGPSFGEIFAGNCAAIGLVTAVLDGASVERLQTECESHPEKEFVLDLEARLLLPGRISLSMPEGLRRRYLNGTWDSLTWLLQGDMLPMR